VPARPEAGLTLPPEDLAAGLTFLVRRWESLRARAARCVPGLNAGPACNGRKSEGLELMTRQGPGSGTDHPRTSQ
jgi:hypothetical protein